MSAKKFIPIIERFPKHYRQFLEEVKKPTDPIHWRPSKEKWRQDERTKIVTPIQNVPIPVIYPSESNQGIWGGEGLVQGFKEHRPSVTKYGHMAALFNPILYRHVVYSEILDKYMRVIVTMRTLQLIDKHYGFDAYILETPVKELKSKLAYDLRRMMLLALVRQDLYPDNPEKRAEIVKKYQHHIIPEEEAEWFGLSLAEATQKLEEIEDDPNPEPLKIAYRKEFIQQLIAQKAAPPEEISDDGETPSRTSRFLSRINPFKSKAT